MENLFSEILNSIRTRMTEGIQSIRTAGQANHEDAVAVFRQYQAVDIIRFKEAVSILRQQVPDDQGFDTRVSQKEKALREIMQSPNPDAARYGLYVSPVRPTDRLYFWAYQDLHQLCAWIQAYKRRRSEIFLPLEQLAAVRWEFEELAADEATLRHLGIREELVNLLLQLFSDVRSLTNSDLKYTDLFNLRKLKAAIQDCCGQGGGTVDHTLHMLLYEYNVNTREAAIYCRDHLVEQLAGFERDDDKLDLLILWEKLIQQVIVESNMAFDPYRDLTLVDQMQRVINAEYNAIVKRMDQPARATAVPQARPVVRITVTNEHHAAYTRSLKGIGYYDGLDKDIFDMIHRSVLSCKDQLIAILTFRNNYSKPTNNAANEALATSLRQANWMSDQWHGEYDGIPNFNDMDPYDIGMLVLSYRK